MAGLHAALVGRAKAAARVGGGGRGRRGGTGVILPREHAAARTKRTVCIRRLDGSAAELLLLVQLACLTACGRVKSRSQSTRGGRQRERQRDARWAEGRGEQLSCSDWRPSVLRSDAGDALRRCAICSRSQQSISSGLLLRLWLSLILARSRLSLTCALRMSAIASVSRQQQGPRPALDKEDISRNLAQFVCGPI